jgi:hypothetical protein
MKPHPWQRYFSPQEWAFFKRDAARRGVSPEDLARKYLFRALERVERAEKYADMEDLLLKRWMHSFHEMPVHPQR